MIQPHSTRLTITTETTSLFRSKLRDHVAHRGAQGLSISISEECGTTAVSIAGQPYEIVERCEMWGKFVGDMILDVDPDLRKKI